MLVKQRETMLKIKRGELKNFPPREETCTSLRVEISVAASLIFDRGKVIGRDSQGDLERSSLMRKKSLCPFIIILLLYT